MVEPQVQVTPLVPQKERIEKVETGNKRKRLKKKVVDSSIPRTISKGVEDE